MLVMIRRDRHWLVRACAFHFLQEKRTFPNQHKVSVPSYFRFTSCMHGKMFWLALLQSGAWTSPLFPTWGAISDVISDHVGKQIASLGDDIRLSDVSLSVATNVSTAYISKSPSNRFSEAHISAVNKCKNVTHRKCGQYWVPENNFLEFSPCPFIGLNKIRKWLFVFEKI